MQLVQTTGFTSFPENTWSPDQRDWILIEVMVRMNHRAQILQCQQVFCSVPPPTPAHANVDHHTLVAPSYLGTVRSWQRNKSHNEVIRVERKTKRKKPQIPFEKKKNTKQRQTIMLPRGLK